MKKIIGLFLALIFIFVHNISFAAADSDFVIVDDGLLIDYNGSDEHVVIPVGVKRICSDALRYCTTVTSVTIPDSVIYIDGNAFGGGGDIYAGTENWSESKGKDGPVITDIYYCGSEEQWNSIDIEITYHASHSNYQLTPLYPWQRGATLHFNSTVPDVSSLLNFKRVNEYPSGLFTDIPVGTWFENEVITAYELGLVKGKSENTYEPTGNILISEAITLAARLHNTYNGSTADFVQGEPWYRVYVDYALENGIITDGYDYDAIATRAQFAKILAKALEAEALPAINDVKLGSLPDVPSGADYANEVYLLYNAGILTGNDADGTFAPDSFIQRSEVAAIVTRMADVSLRKSFTLAESGYTPTQTIEENGHTYALYDYEMSWTEAKALCEDMGGYLATITGADENRVITLLAASGSSDAYWLGGTSTDDADNQFRWITSEPFLYTNWYEGEPSNSDYDGETEGYLEIRNSYDNKWNDVINTNKADKGFILEKGSLITYEETDWEKAYADVLNEYKQAISKGLESGKADWSKWALLGERILDGYTYEEFGYSIIDINKNGSSELILYVKIPDVTGVDIISVYSLRNNIPYCLIPQNSRAFYGIRTDGTLVRESGDAEWKCSAFKLEQDDITLTLIEEMEVEIVYGTDSIEHKQYINFGNGRIEHSDELNKGIFYNVPDEYMDLSFKPISMFEN